jgi:hypothetical protein
MVIEAAAVLAGLRDDIVWLPRLNTPSCAELIPEFGHSGMVRQTGPGNLEIPGSMLRIAPE